jgi:two-component system NtrC family sensor kinase
MAADRHYKSLMKSMLLTGVVVPLIPMVLVSGIILYQSRASYKNEIQTYLEEVIQQGTERIDHFLEERLADISLLADTFSFQQLTDEFFLLKMLDRLQKHYGSAFSDLEVIDDEGVRVAYAGPLKSANPRHLGSDWYREVMRSGYVIGNVTFGSGDIPHIVMAVRKSRMGKDWVLLTGIDRDVFNRVVKETATGRSGSAFVINRNGQYQAGSIHHIDPGERSLMDFLGIREGVERDIFVVQRTNGSGHENIYVTSFLKTGDWALVYYQRASEAFSGLRRTETIALTAILMVSLLIGANAISLSKKMIRRIQQADREKQKQNEQMFQTGKLASIGELAAGIAHEINNPVAIMVEEAGWIDDLLEEKEFQQSKNLSEFQRALGQIRTQGERCKEITHKLLSFARKTDSRLETIRLNELIEDMVTISAKRARFSGIIINMEIEKDLPPIEVSPSELQQVFLNLINNALDAMEKKGGTLSISSRLEEDHIVIEVSDDGVGIPEDNLSQIFDPFFTTKPVGKGTGLGLSICYGIIKKLGGEISVRSIIGKGSTFRVRLPLKGSGKSNVEGASRILNAQQ